MDKMSPSQLEQEWLHYQGVVESAIRSAGTRCDHDLADLMQEVALTFADDHPAIREPSAIRSWLVAVATNAVRKLHRKPKRNISAELNDLEGPPGIPFEQGSIDPGQDSKALRALSDRELEVFNLVEIRGLTQRQAAVSLGRAEGTIASCLHRARPPARFPSFIHQDTRSRIAKPNDLPVFDPHAVAKDIARGLLDRIEESLSDQYQENQTALETLEKAIEKK